MGTTVDGIKIPVVVTDQTGAGFASATANTKKFSQSMGQMAQQYETETGRSFKAISRGIAMSTFGFVSLGATFMMIGNSIKKFADESIDAYDKSGIASQSYRAALIRINEAQKDFRVQIGSMFEPLVEAWRNAKAAALDYMVTAETKMALQIQKFETIRDMFKKPDELNETQKKIALIIGYSKDDRARNAALALGGFTKEDIEYTKKIIDGWTKEADDKRKEDQKKRDKEYKDALKKHQDYIDEIKKSEREYNTQHGPMEPKGYKNAWTGYIDKMNIYTIENIKDTDIAIKKSKTDWQSYGQVVSSTFSLMAAGASAQTKKITDSLSSITSSMFTAISLGTTAGWVSAGIGVLASVVDMFRSDKSSDSAQAQQIAAAKTAQRYDSVTRQGTSIYNITPTVIITSQNGVQVFGDNSVTSGSLMNLIRTAMQRDISNNAINLAGAAPAGAGL